MFNLFGKTISGIIESFKTRTIDEYVGDDVGCIGGFDSSGEGREEEPAEDRPRALAKSITTEGLLTKTIYPEMSVIIRAVMQIIVSLVLLFGGIILVFNENTDSQKIGVSLVSLVAGYWIS